MENIMGDRTWVRITYAKQSELAVMEAFGWSEDDYRNLNIEEEHCVVNACIDEVNWGGYNEMMDLAKKGVTFLAHSGAGGSYGESMNVGYKGEFVDVQSSEGEPVCTVDGRGKPNTVAMKHIRSYMRLAKKAEREFDRIRTTHREAA